MNPVVTIEACDLGFVVRCQDALPSSHAVETVEQALQRALFCLTGKSNHFGGRLYGKVSVSFEHPQPDSGGEQHGR